MTKDDNSKGILISKSEIAQNLLLKKFIDEIKKRSEITKEVTNWMDGDDNITFPIWRNEEVKDETG